MNLLKRLSAMMAAAVLAGCTAVETESWQNCAIAGAALGAAAGAYEDSHDDFEDGLIGAAAGGIIGGTICALLAEEQAEVAPEPDTDGDGVVDSLDECPETPAGTPVDSKGCATNVDSDGDGVPDVKDQCPDTPKGAKVNALGCSKPLILKGVNFHFDSDQLTEDAKAILKPIAQAHHEFHDDVNLVIGGHTDSQGSDAYNADLSQRRAESVRQFMIANGCKAERLTAKGYGESKPIADNGTKAGRAENRRVELTVK